MKSIVLQTAFFLALAVIGSHLMQVAAQEQHQRVANVNALQPQALFNDLRPCDVPGLRERVLSRGGHTIAFAGVFTPVDTIPWVTGNARIYLYVTSGSGVARIEGVTRRISAGDFLVIPKRARHAVSALTTTMQAIYVEDST
jgi:quercetin dioxygenase-like cupin family protein